jgi:coenzyme F420-0:L-glutamate ligase / coenzyme F420-1:gamma-L-glutamate ligase
MRVEIFPVAGLPEIGRGQDLAEAIADAVAKQATPLENGDVVVVTQKIVSKSEGRLVPLASVIPSPMALAWGSEHGTDARLLELVLRESRRIVRMERGLIIAETVHGFICANAGVDLSNVDGGTHAALLPDDPDRSARAIRDGLHDRTGREVAVVISDTFGRPFREGLVNTAIGIAGMRPLKSYVGRTDPHGYPLQASVQALADEVAAAAGLAAGKLDRVPVTVARGVPFVAEEGSVQEIIRDPSRDLFR